MTEIYDMIKSKFKIHSNVHVSMDGKVNVMAAKGIHGDRATLYIYIDNSSKLVSKGGLETKFKPEHIIEAMKTFEAYAIKMKAV